MAAGRLELQKDQITLLQAIKNISNIYLIIIGYGKEKNYLKKYIKENNLNKKVLILDKIANLILTTESLNYSFLHLYMKVFLMSLPKQLCLMSL